MEFRVQGETAIIKYLKMGGLKTTEIYFSVWKTGEIIDEVPNRSNVWCRKAYKIIDNMDLLWKG